MKKPIELKSYSRKTPTHCHICGTPLVRKTYFRYFDEYSGKKLYGTTLYCPNKVLWFFSHLKIDFSETGNEIISYDY